MSARRHDYGRQGVKEDYDDDDDGYEASGGHDYSWNEKCGTDEVADDESSEESESEDSEADSNGDDDAGDKTEKKSEEI